MTLTILLLGLAVGVLVGLLGIGGGAVLVPALVYVLHMDQHLAQGTSLFILLPPIGLGALGGSLIALPLASRHLQGMFGCFLMLSAILLWRKAHPDSRGDVAREPGSHG